MSPSLLDHYMLTRLSEMLRYSLSNNKVDTIRLVDEIEMVENYIALPNNYVIATIVLPYHEK